MLIGDILNKIYKKNNALSKVSPPPQVSVFLMTFAAIIAVINLNILAPNTPRIILLLPGVIAIIFGALYPRWVYLSLLALVAFSRYFFGVSFLNETENLLIQDVLIISAIVILIVEVEKLFWKETQLIEKGFEKYDGIITGLEKTLFSSSRMIDPQIGTSELLSVCVDRFRFSSASIYHDKKNKNDKEDQKLLLYANYEDRDYYRCKNKKLPEIITDLDIHVNELMRHLEYKSIAVSSSITPNDFLNNLREELNVKTLIAIGIEYQREIVGCVFLIDTKESMNYDSFNNKLLLIIQSISELLYDKALIQKKSDKLRARSYSLTKMAIEDINSLIDEKEEI